MSDIVDAKQVPCPRCGAMFVCGVANGGDTCWCAEMPPRYAVQTGQCLCPDCLKKSVSLPSD